MDGKGRWMDNVFIERLGRTLKYDEVYLHAYDDLQEARAGIASYLDFYNTERPHQALGYQTPTAFYEGLRSQQLQCSKLSTEIPSLSPSYQSLPQTPSRVSIQTLLT